ncbi:hypothetical protein BDK61_2067 [Haloarcula quadrata]|mgnify:CR=1 FL=1|uniref:Uncharacterized protein n=1 Tax=Haloarcula quadrata TaxID=182779 RepID=A0A495R6A2_9EURY|nr:hypothetical protein BDK61_2067 [Haloarcula quadrata]
MDGFHLTVFIDLQYTLYPRIDKKYVAYLHRRSHVLILCLGGCGP